MTTTDPVLTRRAPAKINLTLHMTGLRDDGYHLLDSLVVFTEFGDDLTVKPHDDLVLHVDGPLADGVPTDHRNLVMKAAQRLRDLRGVTAGADMRLTKHLPHGAGIGGGSSDAAAALDLLANLWDVPVLTTDEALPLGADVPVCLCAPHATLMRGIGEDLTRAPYQPTGWLVLVNPGVVVSTVDVFKLYDALYGNESCAMDDMDEIEDRGDFEIWLLGQRNDLAKVASEKQISPVVQDVLKVLRADALDCDMSGSGSTCWGLHHSKETAQASAEKIAKAHPDWWVQVTRILP